MKLAAAFDVLGLCILFGLGAAQNSTCTSSGWTYDASPLYKQTLTSSNYLFFQEKGIICSGTIRTSDPSGYIMKITFNNFYLGDDTFCKTADSYLEFFDGPNSSSPSIGKFCGYVYPEVVYSTGRYLHMKFVGGSWVTYRGFSFNFSAVLAGEASGMCLPNKPTNNNLQLNRSSGTFFSPNYPVNYKAGTRCIWIISVPTGKRIRLTFLYGFHVYYNTSCRQDFVEVRDGSSFTSRKIGKYCGSNPGFVESSTNVLWVKFRSNSDDDNGAGFKVRYTAVDAVAVACTYSGWTYDASALRNQTLTSSLYLEHNDDLKDADCSGTIRTTTVTGYVVKIVVTDFWIRDFDYMYHRDCYTKESYLEFYDGPSSSYELISTFCSAPPEVVYSSGRYLYINYVVLINNITFSLNYSAVPEGEASGICSSKRNNLQLNGSSGTFFTPNYPVPYKHGTTCIWIISAPLGKRVRVMFTKIDLSFTKSCSKDFVEIHDGKSSTSTDLGKYCGMVWGQGVESTGNYLRVMFQADSGVQNVKYAGFKAEYQAIDSFKADSNDPTETIEVESETRESNTSMEMRVVVGVAVFIFVVVVLSFIAVKLRKKNEQPRVTEEVVPLTPTDTITASQSTAAPLPVSVAALQEQSLLGNEEDPPPPYPAASPASQGEGGDTVISVAFQGEPVLPYKEASALPYCPSVPQYPPPGELYPWQQSLNDA